MNKIPLFFLLLIVPFFVPNFAESATRELKSAELINLLQNRSFTQRNIKKNKNYTTYFAIDGKYESLSSNKHTKKSGKWTVEKNGDLCFNKVIRRTIQNRSQDVYISKCGKVFFDDVKKILLHYDEEGPLLSKFKFLGNGNLITDMKK